MSLATRRREPVGVVASDRLSEATPDRSQLRSRAAALRAWPGKSTSDMQAILTFAAGVGRGTESASRLLLDAGEAMAAADRRYAMLLAAGLEPADPLVELGRRVRGVAQRRLYGEILVVLRAAGGTR